MSATSFLKPCAWSPNANPPGDPTKRAREAKATLLPKGYRVLCATYAEDRQAMHRAGYPDCADDDWLSLKD